MKPHLFRSFQSATRCESFTSYIRPLLGAGAAVALTMLEACGVADAGPGGVGIAGGRGGQSVGGGGSGGTGQGGGGDAGGAPPTNETCALAQAVNLEPGSISVLSGTTRQLHDDYKSFCGVGTASGPDAVYAVMVPQNGTLQLVLTPVSSQLDAVLYVRAECENPASTLVCADETKHGEEVRLAAEAGQIYFVFVDGRGGTDGPFELRLALNTENLCGDGVVNQGEDCDFGPDEPGDGCSACMADAIPQEDKSDKCPGQTFQLGPPPNTPSVTLSMELPAVYTTGYQDDYDAPCCACGCPSGGAPDRVFAFNLPKGTLTATSPPGMFDVVLGIFSTCEVGPGALSSIVGCSDACEKLGGESVSVPVNGTSQYFVVVDGYGPASFGKFDLTVEWKE